VQTLVGEQRVEKRRGAERRDLKTEPFSVVNVCQPVTFLL